MIEGYKELIRQIDADEAKIRQDAEQRMKAEEEMKKAVETKGDEKQKIFEEAKRKEQEMKANEAAIKAANEISEKDKGTGSVWNANSYFWEEKNFNKWSNDKLQEYLGNFKHTVPGGSLEITD